MKAVFLSAGDRVPRFQDGDGTPPPPQNAQNCHSEGAPRPTCLTTTPSARPRNLLSVPSWPVAHPGPALSGACASANRVRAAASAHEVAESRFFGPATCGAKGGCGVARPQNDRAVLHHTGAAQPPQRPAETLRRFQRAELSFRGSAAPNLPYHRSRRATEESTLGFLVARRAPRTGPVRRLRIRKVGAGCRVCPPGGREQILRPCNLRRESGVRCGRASE
jgi:hypothetical protein